MVVPAWLCVHIFVHGSHLGMPFIDMQTWDRDSSGLGHLDLRFDIWSDVHVLHPLIPGMDEHMETVALAAIL